MGLYLQILKKPPRCICTPNGKKGREKRLLGEDFPHRKLAYHTREKKPCRHKVYFSQGKTCHATGGGRRDVGLLENKAKEKETKDLRPEEKRFLHEKNHPMR